METLNNYQSIWFAWYPVLTESGEWAWLENVGRTEDFDEENSYNELRWKYKYYKLNAR